MIQHDNNVECSTGVIFLDPCPNKLINCESINADLHLIYHQFYWECVFSFSKEREHPRLDDCLKEKCSRSKVSHIQKKFLGKHNFWFGVAYSNKKMEIEVNTAIY